MGFTVAYRIQGEGFNLHLAGNENFPYAELNGDYIRQNSGTEYIVFKNANNCIITNEPTAVDIEYGFENRWHLNVPDALKVKYNGDTNSAYYGEYNQDQVTEDPTLCVWYGDWSDMDVGFTLTKI